MTREEAVEILQGAIKKPNTKDGYLGQAIDMAIKALEQEPNWIPVSEKLPEERVNVLICDIDGDVYIAYMWNIIYANRIAWSDASSFDNIKSVIAWMPLPKPYREVEE